LTFSEQEIVSSGVNADDAGVANLRRRHCAAGGFLLADITASVSAVSPQTKTRSLKKSRGVEYTARRRQPGKDPNRAGEGRIAQAKIPHINRRPVQPRTALDRST
jgi:hypothetical protein